MPIYEYECTKCGVIEEALQKFSDKPRVKCKHCSGKLQKLISHSSFHLKGTGWYVTDYSNKLKDPNLSRPSASAGGKQDSGASGVSGGGESSGGDSSSTTPKSDAGSSTSSPSSSSTSSSSTSTSTSAKPSGSTSSSSASKPSSS